MEGLSIRDWMIVIIVLLLLAVVVDGYRRTSRDRKTQVRLSRNAKRAKLHEEAYPTDNFTSELPNGGARVVGVMEGPDIDPKNPPSIASEIRPLPVKEDPRVSAMLGRAPKPASEPARQEPTINADESEVANVVEEAIEPLPNDDPLFVDTHRKKNKKNKRAHKSHVQPSLFDDEKSREAKADMKSDAGKVAKEEIIVLNVLSKDKGGFRGEQLMEILLACDCRFGEMNIFHRYEAENAKGAIQFSIVNIVEPGVFNIEDIKDFSTPGVSFFLRLPGPDDPMVAFDCMVETANCLAKNLKGELKDERRSTATQQTIEHTRERVRSFIKRQMIGA